MPIPTYDEFMHPLLRILAHASEPMRSRDVYATLADAVGLTDEDRREMLPSGRQAVYKNRIGWAHDRLKRAGWAESAKRGYWQATPEGLAALKAQPGGFDEETRRRLVRIEDVGGEDDVLVPPEEPGVISPTERLHEAVAELKASLAAEILEQIANNTPEFFESMVLDVLHNMGYGATKADLQRTQTSADEGIDGIITLDRLGLEKVYIQAKRWANGVSRPEIQKFVGALAGQGATRGVFITTSRFTPGASQYANGVTASVVLVDGAQLADLMIEYEVGVTVQETFKVARVDHDYFDEG